MVHRSIPRPRRERAGTRPGPARDDREGSRLMSPLRRLASLVALGAIAATWSNAAPVLAGGPATGARPANLPPVYPHGSFTRQLFGSGARSYWLFEPADPAPERAPVVVF